MRHSDVEVDLSIIQAKSALENFPLFAGNVTRLQNENDVREISGVQIRRLLDDALFLQLLQVLENVGFFNVSCSSQSIFLRNGARSRVNFDGTHIQAGKLCRFFVVVKTLLKIE